MRLSVFLNWGRLVLGFSLFYPHMAHALATPYQINITSLITIWWVVACVGSNGRFPFPSPPLQGRARQTQNASLGSACGAELDDLWRTAVGHSKAGHGETEFSSVFCPRWVKNRPQGTKKEAILMMSMTSRMAGSWFYWGRPPKKRKVWADKVSEVWA